MDTEEQTAPEADDTTDSGTPAQTVRVPNVSPGAKSGLDHTVIGSDALAPPQDDEDDDQGDDEPDGDPMPDGDLDARLAWVGEAQDSDTAKARADKVWAAHQDDTDPEANGRLASGLHTAVYGKPAETGQHVAEVSAGGGVDSPAKEDGGDGPADPNATDADED